MPVNRISIGPRPAPIALERPAVTSLDDAPLRRGGGYRTAGAILLTAVAGTVAVAALANGGPFGGAPVILAPQASTATLAPSRAADPGISVLREAMRRPAMPDLAAPETPTAPKAAPVEVARVEPAAVAAPVTEAPVSPALSAAAVASLLERTKPLLAMGDVGAARRLAERAAAGGSANALFALAEMHDPAMLAEWKVRGVLPDAERARSLYAQALEHGDARASQRLAALR